MKGSRRNTFRKAIHYLKSNQIDEKIELLNELPTNNTSGIYLVEPEYYVQDPDVPGSEPVDFTQDDPASNGRDTTGLFGTDGSILTIEPDVGDTSYILGPMASMWYAWGNFTTIGYIRESDRRMVDLGRIIGRLGSWDGSSNFTSYGQLTLEQAVWFRDTPKLNGADNDTPNYRAFYPGPPSNSPDAFGRYLCVITGTPKPTAITPPPRRVPSEMGGFDPNIPPGEARPKKPKEMTDAELYEIGLYRGSDGKLYPLPDEGKAKPDIYGDLIILGISAVAAAALIKTLGAAAAYAATRAAKNSADFLEWWNKGRNQRIPNENNANWRDLIKDDWGQRGRPGDGSGGGWDPTRGFRPGVPADKGGIGSGPTPAIRQLVERPFRSLQNIINPKYKPKPTQVRYKTDPMDKVLRDIDNANRKLQQQPRSTPSGPTKKRFPVGESYDKDSDYDMIIDALDNAVQEIETLGDLKKFLKIISEYPKKKNSSGKIEENRKKILRNIKKPYVLPEQPKVKYKIKPNVIGKNRTINVDLMKKAEVPSSFKKAEERLWGKYEKEQNTRFSQERKNEVLDHLGGSNHAWEYMTETSRKKNNDIMYGNFGGTQKKGKVVRREELKGDTLLFISDENGKKETILQSELSIRLADEFNKELFEKYFQEQETLDASKDSLFNRVSKKVSKKLKSTIDDSDKPSKNGYPDTPPPEMKNGMHPDLVDGKKVADRFNRLDPQSAKAMPLTGNPHIDKKVLKARKKPK